MSGHKIIDMTNARIVGMNPDARAKECMEHLKRVLVRYNCSIVPIVSVRGDGLIMGGFEVIPNKK